ncbi:hypothetical protein [Paraburkholderia sp. CI3]|uniref:hypothetical protein n=1 Tax=Paraburkholderia sp. CI3 TaxID=2991060 RepID=UPI003D1E12E7
MMRTLSLLVAGLAILTMSGAVLAFGMQASGWHSSPSATASAAAKDCRSTQDRSVNQSSGILKKEGWYDRTIWWG